MRVSGFLLLAAAMATALPGIAAAGERKSCLSQEERRAMIGTHKAIPLARAVRDVRRRTAGAEVVGARLCYHGDELVYVLTVLARDGKVTRASVNAASGVLIDGW